MNIEIVTPDTVIFEGEASLAQLPGIDGSFEILNNHAPLISVLKAGTVKIIVPDKSTKTFEIKGGVVEMHRNKLLILAE